MMHPRNAYASPPNFLGLARGYPTIRSQYVLVFHFQFVVSGDGWTLNLCHHPRWDGYPGRFVCYIYLGKLLTTALGYNNSLQGFEHRLGFWQPGSSRRASFDGRYWNSLCVYIMTLYTHVSLTELKQTRKLCYHSYCMVPHPQFWQVKHMAVLTIYRPTVTAWSFKNFRFNMPRKLRAEWHLWIYCISRCHNLPKKLWHRGD